MHKRYIESQQSNPHTENRSIKSTKPYAEGWPPSYHESQSCKSYANVQTSFVAQRWLHKPVAAGNMSTNHEHACQRMKPFIEHPSVKGPQPANHSGGGMHPRYRNRSRMLGLSKTSHCGPISKGDRQSCVKTDAGAACPIPAHWQTEIKTGKAVWTKGSRHLACQLPPKTSKTSKSVTVEDSESKAHTVNDSKGPHWKRKGSQKCPLCRIRTRKLKYHVVRIHFPKCFHRRYKNYACMRVEALKLLMTLSIGPHANLRDLCQKSEQHTTKYEAGTKVEDPRLLEEMKEVAHVLGEQLPDEVVLKPMSCRAALIHWRPILALLKLLNREQQLQFRKFKNESLGVLEASLEENDNGETPDDSMPVQDAACNEANLDVVEEEIQTSAMTVDEVDLDSIPSGIDAHYKMNWFDDEATTDINATIAKARPAILVRVVGGVAVFSDPERYPPDDIEFPIGWKMSIGIHPRKQGHLTNDSIRQYRKWIRKPNVSLGLIGLDRTASATQWKQQEDLFVKMISNDVDLTQVLVLHMKGEDGDRYGDSVGQRCRSLVAGYRGSRQLLHLQCFTGSKEEVKAWLEQFPNVYFGFNGMVENFDDVQIDALKSVPTDRLLLESSVPWMYKKDNPANLGEVASLVANILGMTLESVLQNTAENAIRLYKL